MGSLNDLPASRMISISAAWLDPARERARFNTLSSGRALLDIIQMAHDGLLAARPKDDAISREVTGIIQNQSRLDSRHDRKIRALYHLLTGFADASDDPNEVADLLSARDELLPNGLSITSASYLEQANHAEMAAQRASSSTKGLLKKITLPRGLTLWNLVEQWFAAGRELKTLEHKKDRLETSPGSTGADVFQARAVWIRVAQQVQTALEMERAPADVVAAILQPLRLAEQETP